MTIPPPPPPTPHIYVWFHLSAEGYLQANDKLWRIACLYKGPQDESDIFSLTFSSAFSDKWYRTSPLHPPFPDLFIPLLALSLQDV